MNEDQNKWKVIEFNSDDLGYAIGQDLVNEDWSNTNEDLIEIKFCEQQGYVFEGTVGL